MGQRVERRQSGHGGRDCSALQEGGPTFFGQIRYRKATRPIGLTCSLTQDALRPWAHRASKVLACILAQYGQLACGVRAGGEAAQTAAQAKCDMNKWIVTVAIDYANAFGLVDNVLTYHALAVCMCLVRTDVDIQRRLAAAGVEVREAVLALEFMQDDLVWTRTTGFCNVTVVEGFLRCLYPNIGETQGGLFSALRYVVAKAVAVDRPLAHEFPCHVMRSIVDDGIMQATVSAPEHVETLVQWMWRLDKLVRGVDRPDHVDPSGHRYPIQGVMGRLHFGKFKLLQHPDAAGTAFDLEAARDRFPSETVQTDGGPKIKRPTVVRDMLEFNGAAIGFDVQARKAHVMQEVRNLGERTARLINVAPLIGRQRTEVYGRASYRASSVLMHQMRAVPPSVGMEAMGRATEMQLELFRAATGASAEMVGGAKHGGMGRGRVAPSVRLPVQPLGPPPVRHGRVQLARGAAHPCVCARCGARGHIPDHSEHG